jgi:hypothetical protein
VPSGPLSKPARSPILSIAFCQPASASFRAVSVAALASSTPEFEALLGSVVGGIGKSEFGCSPVKSSEFGWRQEIAAALQSWRNLSTLSAVSHVRLSPNFRRETESATSSALCHVWTAPGWQVKTSRHVAGRCSHVFGLLARFA